MATEVGEAYVTIIPSARGFARTLQRDIAKEFSGSGLDKLIADALGDRKPIRLPVQAEVDPKAVPDKLQSAKKPKLAVELDPLTAAFQAEVKKTVGALARQVNADIPVTADTAQLRTELAAELAAIQRTVSAQVPTEPGELRLYEQRLRAAVASASNRVTANIKTVPAGGSSSFFSGFTGGGGVANGLKKAFDDLTASMAQSGSAAVRTGGELLSAIAPVAGPIAAAGGALLGMSGALTALASAALLAGPALSTLIGLAGSLPGAVLGASAAFGTLALGFKGIGEAFADKPGGGGGGAAADLAGQARRVGAATRGVEAARRGIAAANRGVAAAERNLADAEANVADAQRRSTAAAEALAVARREARDDLADLNRALRGAQLDEEDAALAVTEALRELNAVKELGNLPDIQRADLAYRQAQQTLEDAKASTSDLAAEQADAAKKGVAGSDKVLAALQNQQDAIRGVADAQAAVVQAQDGVLSANDGLKSSYDGLLSAQDALAESQKKTAASGGAAAAAVTKLAPAAQKFVDAVKALAPAFERLRLDVQQRLFEDLDKTVTNLGNAWIPQLHETLGNYATTFNQFFKDLGSTLTTPKVIDDLAAGAEGARKGLAAILDSVSGPLVKAFASLAKAAAPFLEDLGKELAGLVGRFADWVEAGEKSGALQDFFDRASKAMSDIFDIGTSVTRIIGSFIDIIIGSDKTTSGLSPLEKFRNGLQKVADYLDDPENQQKIRDFFTEIQNSLYQVGQFVATIDGWIDKFQALKESIFGKDDEEKAGLAGQGIGRELALGIVEGTKTKLKELGSDIAGALWSGPNSLIGRMKSGLGIASPSKLTTTMGGQLIDGFINGIRNRLTSLGDTVRQLPGRIRDAFGRAGDTLYAAGKNTAIGLINGMLSRARDVGRYAGELRTWISDRFSNAGDLLYNAGRAVVRGLISGLGSMISTLGNYLGGIGQFIRDNKGPIEKDRKLLVPAGRAIMQGLIAGIGAEKAALGAELDAVTGMFAGIGPAAPGVSTSPYRGYGPGRVELAWAPGATGDPILDGFRGTISARYNGDPLAALGS